MRAISIILFSFLIFTLFSCQQSEEDKSEAKGFVKNEDGTLRRECDFSQGSIENLASYFKSRAYEAEHLPGSRAHEIYRNMSIAGWEYLYCLVKGDLQPGEKEIALPADLLLDHLRREKVIPDDVPGIVKQFLDPEKGIYLERLESTATTASARLVLNLNANTMKDQRILDQIEEMIAPKLGDYMERKFIKSDKVPAQIAFGQIPEDFITDQNIGVNGKEMTDNREVDGVFIIYEASVFFGAIHKTIFSVVEDVITIDINVNEETFLTPQKHSFKGVSTVNIGNIQGIGLYGGDDDGDHFKMGGNLAAVFKNFRITRADLDFDDQSGKATLFGGSMQSTLDFSSLFNGTKIKSDFDKDLIEPTLESLSQGYFEAAAAEFRTIYFNRSLTVEENRDYLLKEFYHKAAGPVESGMGMANKSVEQIETNRQKVKVWINNYLGSENPPKEMIQELVHGIYSFLKGNSGSRYDYDQGTTYHKPPPPNEVLGKYLYETFVVQSPHVREVEVHLPFVDAQSYYEFTRGMEVFSMR